MLTYYSSLTHRWVSRFFALSERSDKHISMKLSLVLLLVFSTFSNVHAANSPNDRVMAPIIMLLLDDNSVSLTIGVTNTNVLTSADFPDGVRANFGPASDGLNLSFVVEDLQTGQSLELVVNGRVIQSISANGNYDIELSSEILNSRSNNTIEFNATPANATWTIRQIRLINSEGPFNRAEAVRFLTKATFGANEESISRLLSLGYEAWVDEQLLKSPTLHVPYFDQQRLEHNAVGIGTGNATATFNCGLRTQTWLNGAVYGEDQLLQRMAFALSQIFVVGDSACDSVAQRYTHYYDVLLNDALGNYRDLLENVTLSSAMGGFLSLSGSNANTAQGFTPDENYARELMQLFSIGVFELNLDGSLKLENGRPIDTYDDEIIVNMALALSGWQRDFSEPFPFNQYAPLIPWNGLWAVWHSYDEKTILNGVVIPGGDRIAQTGNNILDDLKIVLDTVVAHDNVAPFISKQLIQRFVTSNPSPAYIERVATVFNDNGAGVKGDLSAVIKAILLDSESLNSHENLLGGKLKEPLLRATQIWRAFDVTNEVGFLRYTVMSGDFGQRPLGSESVFNFYRPDYAPAGEILDRGLVAPEFQLSGDSLLLSHVPAMRNILRSETINPDDVVSASYTSALTVRGELNLTTAEAISDNSAALMNYFNSLLFGGLMSNELRNRVIQYIDDEVVYSSSLSDEERRQQKVEEALLILGISPEFNVQR